MTVNDPGGLLGACMGGLGVGQVLELYAGEFLASGRLAQILPDWAEERFPLYAYLPTRRLMSAKVRAFLDFVSDLA